MKPSSLSGSGNITSTAESVCIARTEEFYQRVYQRVATGIAVTDWHGVFQECNPAYCALLGYTEKELRTIDFASLIHPGDREANLAQVRRLQGGEIPAFQIENRYIHKNGEPVWVHKFVSVLHGAEGEPTHLIALVTDITERHSAEEMLREGEERYRKLAEQVSDGIFVADSQGRYLDANRAGCEMLGYTLEELKTLTLQDILHPDELQRLPEQLLRLASGQILRNEWRFRHKNGTIFFGELVGRQFPDGRLHGIVRDITERKLAEAALSSVSGRILEAQDQERAWIARELHDDISQRLTLVAIDLDRERQNVQSSADEIRWSVGETYKQVLELASDLHAMSHRLHSFKLDSLGLAPAAEGFCRELAERQKIEIGFRSEGIPQGVPGAISLCLFRVLQEALQNAVKHSGAKHFRVSLVASTDQITLTVCDEGRGFDPEEVQGSGLGLTSLKERLKLVGGELNIDAAPRRGTIIRAGVPFNSHADAVSVAF